MSPNVAESVKARLLTRAKAEREEFERTLVRFAGERLLYRLGQSAARDRCVLKGASLLTVWMPNPYRATRDVDVLSFGSPDDDAILALVREICAEACPEDGVRFDSSDVSVDEIRNAEEYVGKRARSHAFLGSAKIHMQMDVGFGDALVVRPEEIEYPTMLRNLPVPCVRAYPREASVAEKFEAMVSLDTRNSRMKDFHDVWALAGAFAFDGAALRASIAACFDRRETPWSAEVPPPLTPAFYQIADLEGRWRSYLAAGGILVAPPGQFHVVGQRIIEFLGPIRESLVDSRSLTKRWQPGGPWQ